jgi:LmbE family N-acetylglucosaminyl deacetylase
MLLLKERGWDIHYMNMCTGNGGSVQMDGPTTTRKRLEEGQEAARILGATFYPPISDDLELTYDVKYLRQVAAVVRMAQPSIVLTHAPADYMEDHMAASRLAVTAAFAHCIPNFQTDPHLPSYSHDVTVYHAMPHGLCDPLRQKLKAGSMWTPPASTPTSARPSPRTKARSTGSTSARAWTPTSSAWTKPHAPSASSPASSNSPKAGAGTCTSASAPKEIKDPLKDALGDLCLINEHLLPKRSGETNRSAACSRMSP